MSDFAGWHIDHATGDRVRCTDGMRVTSEQLATECLCRLAFGMFPHIGAKVAGPHHLKACVFYRRADGN